MAVYSEERKASILKKLLPPHNMSVAEVCAQEGVARSTLFKWRLHHPQVNQIMSHSKNNSLYESAEVRLSVVIETAALTEAELSEYCRKHGLYAEQIQEWKQACIAGQKQSKAQQKQAAEQARLDKKRITQLEKELRRKDKALAETAALLVLQKKFQGLYGEAEEN